MSDKIEEIRERHEAGERASADADREWLLAEVARLTQKRVARAFLQSPEGRYRCYLYSEDGEEVEDGR